MNTEDMQALIRLEQLARQKADGHFTILRFTTCWKACLGTATICNGGSITWPILYGKRCHEAHDHLIPSFPTLREAVTWAIETGESWQDQEAAL